MEKGEGPRYYTEAKDTKSKQRVAQEAEIMFHFMRIRKREGVEHFVDVARGRFPKAEVQSIRYGLSA